MALTPDFPISNGLHIFDSGHSGFLFPSSMDENTEGCTNESESDQDCPEISNIPWLERPKEWTYTMRRHMQEVVPGVFLGPYSAASRSKMQSLLEHGITHIVCVRHAIEANLIRPNFPNTFKYLVLEIADTIMENIIQHFKKVKAFIDEALSSNGRVLVHGNAGISRSAALVLAYVMQTYEVSQMRAYSIVQQRRFCINPNEGFMNQLREYEPIYQAEKTLRNDQHYLEVQRSKRTIHQIEMDNRSQDRAENIMNSW
ncbi:PREDICTED: serine/threonine/tyrosine-interacting protein-like isoform X1 [Wasmannia auropunctata]|uniref:serine/threonine/tyrosine-interacting protein-like isoform X1 n=1 Tax=Wasmannia auropunctata TaxID=64793 RepID=UPI0005EF83AA|nr:PREDICTED: serine/threonine/tyrosine-interacting protein-like isoform X1 [Wasmannia auropunctata]